MNITLFGGSFNPPHLGHLIVIQQAFELIPKMDSLWVLPAYRHTFQKNLAPVKHRLKMSELLIEELHPLHIDKAGSGDKFAQASRTRTTAWPAAQKRKTLKTESFEAKRISVARAKALRLKLSTLEIDHKLSGETYDALQLLKERYPNHTFSFLMGTDQLKGFKKWGSWEKLIEEMPFYIYPRAGYRNKITFPNMSLLESPAQVITNISSTLIRERIRERMQIAHLVPPPVLKYIRIHRVY